MVTPTQLTGLPLHYLGVMRQLVLLNPLGGRISTPQEAVPQVHEVVEIPVLFEP